MSKEYLPNKEYTFVAHVSNEKNDDHKKLRETKFGYKVNDGEIQEFRDAKGKRINASIVNGKLEIKVRFQEDLIGQKVELFAYINEPENGKSFIIKVVNKTEFSFFGYPSGLASSPSIGVCDPIEIDPPEPLGNVLLIIWLTHSGDIGHAALAINNFEKGENGDFAKDFEGNYINEGTYSFYSLYPEDGVNSKTVVDNVSPDYEKGNDRHDDTNERNWETIHGGDPTHYENHYPDGILLTRIDFDTHQEIKKQLDTMVTMGKEYNGVDFNCSDFSAQAYEIISNRATIGKEIITYDDETYYITTPHQLYKDVLALKNTQVIRDPGAQVNKKLEDAYDYDTSTKGIKKRIFKE